MQNKSREWLVRTRTGEVLGPFTQHELFEELQRRSFSLEDEIAPSKGNWISAQTLTNRDSEELTHTSTRNQTMTQSVSNSGTGSTTSFNSSRLGPDDITPTPEAIPSGQAGKFDPNIGAPGTVQKKPSLSPQKLGAVAAGVVFFFALWALLLQMSPKKDVLTTSNSAYAPSPKEGESAFVKEVYALIRAGETQNALKLLSQYHEKRPAKGDVEYLIPYAALLIIEGESPARAKKLLDQVLASAATLSLKSHAHHWLGYLLLSQDEADMGESHFLEALQLNPKDAAARFNLGRAYLKQEKYSQALDYLQLAELEVPDLWLVHIYKGRAKVALGNMEEARNSFRTAVQTSPDRWITYIYYSLFLMGIHENEAAQGILKKMLTRDPHYEIHSPPPIGFYQEKINYSEYLNAFVNVMEKAPTEDRELGKLYINYLMNGPTPNDLKRINALAEKESLLAKIFALQATLEKEGSIDDLRTALKRLPLNMADFGYYAYVVRGEAKSRLGQFADAQQDFQRALALEPKAAATHWAYANLLKKTQRKSDAENEIRSLLSYHPNYIPAIVSTH